VTNDWIAQQTKINPSRFAAFASLSMLRPTEAARELRRAVTELGLVGAILNDWQATDVDGNGILLYDTPDFDPFWEVVQELDVPVYFHPKVFRRGTC
jgi:2,3-dihydroxybenzoate decarboxylase